MAKSISEVMIRAMEEFKTSPEMRNLNIEFGKKACKGRVVRRFSKVDLGFWEEKEDNMEVEPSNTVVDLSFLHLM
ncbi:hypothetical protein COCNU_01G016610 [Cocos nucifera]|uniref:Uncharacterized protein n=1 Tax=Cocos nucifera TaxID=13894 RepID=A0A8K0HW74_COCNU|nr:hypothetical protein COCNU_01G016610 [Cocos nucifera]